MKRRILDAHSHIGMDKFFKFQGSIDEYIQECKKIGVTDSLLMSTPCPVIISGESKVTPLIWNFEDGQFKCYKEKNGEVMEVQKNPYNLVNEILKSTLSKMKNCGINLHCIPLVHPKYDTDNYLEMLLMDNPVAIKMHGISAAFSPYDVSDRFWNIIRKYDVPIIIHTDYDNTQNDTPLCKLRNANTPLEWINVLKKQNVRALLTHGVRLCSDSMKLINGNNNFVIGIGPDSLIASEKERLYKNSSYLETLFEGVSIDQLVFDIDYPWNVKNDRLDFNSIDRIKKIITNADELDKILYYNAQKFFHL